MTRAALTPLIRIRSSSDARFLVARITVAVVVASALVSIEPAPLAAGDAALGRELRISGAKAVREEGEPAVAYNAIEDEFLVVWADRRHEQTRGSEIFGRLIGPDGTRLTRNFRISGSKARDATAPAVAFNPCDNEYLVVWSDARSLATRGTDLYARRISADGERLGRERRISGARAVTDERDPSLAYNARAHEYYVVWSDARNWVQDPVRWFDLFGRRVGARGARIGSDHHLGGRAHASESESQPVIDYDTDTDRYLLAWRDEYVNGTYTASIRGRILTGSGKRVGPTFRISTNPYRDWHPDIAFHSASGQFLVVWENGSAPFASDVYGRWVRPEGTRNGGPFPMSTRRAETSETSPSISLDSTGHGFLVVWSGSWANRSRIVGVNTDADGRPLDGEFAVSSRSSIEPRWPVASPPSRDGQQLVAWLDQRDVEQRGSDIYGRILN